MTCFSSIRLTTVCAVGRSIIRIIEKFGFTSVFRVTALMGKIADSWEMRMLSCELILRVWMCEKRKLLVSLGTWTYFVHFFFHTQRLFPKWHRRLSFVWMKEDWWWIPFFSYSLYLNSYVLGLFFFWRNIFWQAIEIGEQLRLIFILPSGPEHSRLLW